MGDLAEKIKKSIEVIEYGFVMDTEMIGLKSNMTPATCINCLSMDIEENFYAVMWVGSIKTFAIPYNCPHCNTSGWHHFLPSYSHTFSSMEVSARWEDKPVKKKRVRRKRNAASTSRN